jgi:site-specific recombinase XerD
MRVFKSSYKDRTTGKSRQTARWYVELRDHRNIIRRLPAFTDKNQSLALGRTILKLVENRTSGESLTPELSKALELLTDSTKQTLARWGLIEQSKLTGSKLLSEHIADWKDSILARGKTKQHAELSAYRVKSIMESCGFKFYSDISAAKIQKTLADRREDKVADSGKPMRGLSVQSANFYISCCKSFCRWMMRERRAVVNPVEYLECQSVSTDRRHVRRTLSPIDMAKLLTAAKAGPERYGMSGAERALIYELAATTGLRASELASLTVTSFTFGASSSVTIAARSAKNRKAATLPLRSDMATKLAAFTATKLPTAAVFPRLSKFNSARIIRLDLESAGIPYMDASDGIFDFHALRHQFISNLAAAGVHPKTAQELARHSDIKLTMNRYTHVLRGELDKALDLLPDYGAMQTHQSTEVLMTGTDDQRVSSMADPVRQTHGDMINNQNDSAFCLALSGEKSRTPPNSGGQNVGESDGGQTRMDGGESRNSQGIYEKPMVGFEPTTYGLQNRCSAVELHRRTCSAR